MPEVGVEASGSDLDKELQMQIEKVESEIQDLRNALQNETESSERQALKEAIQSKEQELTDLQAKLDDELVSPRRSLREPALSYKMLSYQKELAEKKVKTLLSMYDKWKPMVCTARNKLKSHIPENEVAPLIDSLVKAKEDILSLYSDIRKYTTPDIELRRRVDACESISNDVLKIGYERMVHDEFDAVEDNQRLRELLNLDTTHSIFGPPSVVGSMHSSRHSKAPSVEASRVEAAVELATKEAEYQARIEEQKKKDSIHDLEEQQRKVIEAQKRELERLQAEREVKVARAKLRAYNKVTEEEAVQVDCNPNQTNKGKETVQPNVIHKSNISDSQPDITFLTRAFQDIITLNRLPIPEPFIFNGDPISFIEWKASFTSLIGQRAISPAEKLYYLKRYVGGQARKVLEGSFYRSDKDAYGEAWNKLNQRYGQPFVIQRAFRERLANWPKIHPKDALGLREFSDFLNACHDAIPHVKGLDILNDCEENQKLIKKLPDWVTAQWNRQVTQSLCEKQEFPNLKDFAIFVAREAEIACNPITSFHALRSSDPNGDKQNSWETKGNKASALNTQTVMENQNQGSAWNSKAPCVLCQDVKHGLPSCFEFTAMSLEDRRNYIRERRLCYGCLESGHVVKDCHHRLFCEACGARHPTCLHDFNYGTETPSPRPSADPEYNNAL